MILKEKNFLLIGLHLQFSMTGNFQDREKMRLEKAMRMLYGRFFYRFPNGESAADVYDRITGNSSI